MQPGNHVMVHTDNPHLKVIIDGKEGIIIKPDYGFFDWVVMIPGTNRMGNMFALDENNLRVI
jgi:hypothetical protein